ncbi:MAG: SMI1/KNR4 family protein [Pseudomonadota bacterium]
MLDGKDWQGTGGASEQAIKNLIASAPILLPESYLSFLSHCNGGQGPLNSQPMWLCLYPAEEVAEIERDGTFHEYFPCNFVIGGSCGGDAIALNVSNIGTVQVVRFDMTNIDLEESVQPVAPSFEELIALIGNLEN